MANLKIESMLTALENAGVYPYRQESYRPVYDAQRNLSGRTHYVDDNTLRYFKARINYAYPEVDGLLYTLVESVAHPELGRVHRFVVFDIFGSVVNDRTHVDAFHKTGKQALNTLRKFLQVFDAVEHTKQAAANLAKLKISEASYFAEAAK